MTGRVDAQTLAFPLRRSGAVKGLPIVSKINAISPLAGSLILIVEDDFLLASYLKRLLETQGSRIVGLAARVDKAHALVETTTPDAAILDVNLGGACTLPLAETLRARGVPFVLVTGYGEKELTAEILREAPRLEKPVRAEALIRTLSRLMQQTSPKPQPSPEQPRR
jgi:DNA-binding response OmpR family regulator